MLLLLTLALGVVHCTLVILCVQLINQASSSTGRSLPIARKDGQETHSYRRLSICFWQAQGGCSNILWSNWIHNAWWEDALVRWRWLLLVYYVKSASWRRGGVLNIATMPCRYMHNDVLTFLLSLLLGAADSMHTGDKLVQCVLMLQHCCLASNHIKFGMCVYHPTHAFPRLEYLAAYWKQAWNSSTVTSVILYLV